MFFSWSLVVLLLVSSTWAEEVNVEEETSRELSVGELLERANRERKDPQLANSCYSYVGRTGGAQVVSLSRQGCLYHSTVQHELLHALGFNHEQTRSDRDNHILVYWENIIDDMEYNFYKIDTLNQGTPYDYNSVMQYERNAFSKNNRPTMVPIPNNNVAFGQATQMSRNDIDRLNRLYKC
uniref:low choriolytic enzyme-like n=1 Tax=Solea senegalensis TaxID=28829 RepID=UPI001CD8F35D|nr:low choriolytic enzyme-like [Solea senegalensis]